MKWGKRVAIGLGATAAVAIGADTMDRGLFDGGSGDLGGGADVSSGFEDSGSVGDSQTDLNANYAQLEMEQQGQENALMLLDPVGTEYEMVPNNSGV
jgi:hypothetical protein